MIFNSRVVPAFMLQMTNISGPSINLKYLVTFSNLKRAMQVQKFLLISSGIYVLLTKITASHNEVTLTYHRVREVLFLR